MSLIVPGTMAQGPQAPSLTTMAQGPQAPWGNDDLLAEEYAADPREFLLSRCELAMANCEYMRDLVVCATYYLPPFGYFANGQKFHRPEISQDEALWQGKVGLVVGMGPLAFTDEGVLKFGFSEQCPKIKIGDWVQWDIHDARQFTVNRVHCRWMKDVMIIARVKDPQLVY